MTLSDAAISTLGRVVSRSYASANPRNREVTDYGTLQSHQGLTGDEGRPENPPVSDRLDS
jgi:hypothetical protein